MGKTDPQKLESYLEQRTVYEGGLEPEVERLLDSLEQWPRQPALQPRPSFINKVAGELQQQSRSQERLAAGAVGRIKRLLAGTSARLAAGLAGAVLVVAAAALFTAWFGSLRTVQEAETTPVSMTRRAAIGSLENYPEAPPSLPRYRIEIVPPVTTVEEMEAWAEAFGWPNARLYREQLNPGSVLALTENGAYLSFADPEHGAWHGIGYVEDRERSPALGETLPMAESVAAAEAFLREHGLLPDRYHMRALPSPVGAGYGGYPLRLLLVSPDLDGYALYSDVDNPVGTQLFLDAAGRVFSAGFMEIRTEEAEPVAVGPAEAVVEAFLAGRVEPLAQAFSFPASEPNLTTYEATPPEHAVGAAVTVLGTDSVRVLLPVEESEPLLIQLVTREGGVYSLVGDDLPAIAAAVGDETLRVSGTIDTAMADGKWRLEVESWEVVPRQSILSGCAAGPVTFAEDAVWIEAQATLGDVERGAEYRIAKPPSGLEDGQMVEVCAEPLPEPGGALPWTYIYTPPRALDAYDEVAGNGAAAAEGSRLTPNSFPLKREPEVAGPVSGHPLEGALQEQRLQVDEVELAYFVDTQESMAVDGGSAIASPVWVVRGQILPDGNEFIAYLDATALPLADYPPRDTPYLVQGGDFWLVHTPEGELFAFVPIAPEYRDTVGLEECRYDWNEAVVRFVDPCSGDEWELDGRLNLGHSTELWSNRHLNQYATTVEEGVIRVHLDRVIPGTPRGE